MQSQRSTDKNASRAAKQAAAHAASTIARVTRSAAKMYAGSSGKANTQAAASMPRTERTITKMPKGSPKTINKAAAGVCRYMPKFAPVRVSDVVKPGEKSELLNEPCYDDGAAIVATCSTACASTTLPARADSGIKQLAAVTATLSPSSRLPRTRRVRFSLPLEHPLTGTLSVKDALSSSSVPQDGRGVTENKPSLKDGTLVAVGYVDWTCQDLNRKPVTSNMAVVIVIDVSQPSRHVRYKMRARRGRESSSVAVRPSTSSLNFAGVPGRTKMAE